MSDIPIRDIDYGYINTFENIDKAILEIIDEIFLNIFIDITKDILENIDINNDKGDSDNIDIDIDIDRDILGEKKTNKIFSRFWSFPCFFDEI